MLNCLGTAKKQEETIGTQETITLSPFSATGEH